MKPTEDEVSLATILPKYKEGGDSLYPASEPSSRALQMGAKAAVPGFSGCPWCDSNMDMIGRTTLAVCRKDNRHIVQYLPWGG